jgi:hypothetical protein
MHWIMVIKLFHSFNCITGNSISAEPTRLCNNMRSGQLYVGWEQVSVWLWSYGIYLIPKMIKEEERRREK